MLYSDHNSLVLAVCQKSEPHTMRRMYQLAGIAQYKNDIRYIKGKVNSVADALFCVPVPTDITLLLQSAVNAVIPQGINFITLAYDQTMDGDTQQILKDGYTGLCFRTIQINNVDLNCNDSSSKAHPLALEIWHNCIFDTIHSLSHPGI